MFTLLENSYSHDHFCLYTSVSVIQLYGLQQQTHFTAFIPTSVIQHQILTAINCYY